MDRLRSCAAYAHVTWRVGKAGCLLPVVACADVFKEGGLVMQATMKILERLLAVQLE